MENMEITGKKILVTGGTGFVGSHLVEELIKKDNHVVTTYLEHEPESYFVREGLHKRAEMAHVDIGNFEALHDLISKRDVEYIFHLAAQPLVHVAYKNPRRTFETNVMGTVNVLESARLLGNLKGVIVASSDKAYGKKDDKFTSYTEDDRLRGEQPYEASKSATDIVTYTYYKSYGVPAVTTRFGNIYGEGDMNFSRIIPGAVEAVCNDSQLVLRSDGSFFRDYLYVKDVVRGYLMLAENMPKAVGEAFNFGSEENVSVLELLSAIESACNVTIDYTIQNTAKNEIPFQSLEYTKIQKTLGWKPIHSLESTMPGILSWYQQYFGNKI